jgi:hypothetical protein
MRSTPSYKHRLAVAGVTAIALLAAAVPAAAQTGGVGSPGGTSATSTTDPAAPLGPPGRAKVRKDGTAVAPADAPANIQAAIAAGNAIHTFPYVWGGGHRSFTDSGYDCSGAVSYVLHAAGVLSFPLVSGQLAFWGVPGPGAWITVYANKTHTYMYIAGLRYDTSPLGESVDQGRGPRWRYTLRTGTGFAVRHYTGL